VLEQKEGEYSGLREALDDYKASIRTLEES